MEYGFIFDMDGVVIDSNPYHKIAWERFLDGQGYVYDDQLFEQTLSGRTGPTSLKLLFGDDLPEDQMERYLEEVDGNYQGLLRKMEKATPIAGVHDFISRVKNNGHRLALATSAPPLNIEMGLEKLGMTETFEIIIGKVDVSQGKPHPEVYQKAVDRLGLPAGNCVVFEDSKAGIQSARAAGLPVVGIASGHSKEELLREGASLAVDDFRELQIEEVLELIRKTKV